MQLLAKDKPVYFVAVLLLLGIVAIVVLLWTVQTSLSKNTQLPDLTTPGAATKSETYEVIEFPTRDKISVLTVEFLEAPRKLGPTFVARATVPVGNQTAQFDVVLGGEDTQVRSGTCEYDRSQGKFTGNESYFTEATPKLAERIKTGVRARIRIYQSADEAEQFNKPALVAIRLINEAAAGNKKLDGAVHIVPDEFCVANPI